MAPKKQAVASLVLSVALAGPLASHSPHAPAGPYAAGSHDAAILAWRAGELASAELVERLQGWLANVPASGTARLLSDLVLVAARSGQPQVALAAAQAHSLHNVLPYALPALVAAARSSGDRPLQEAAVARWLQLQPQAWEAQVQEALWLVDEGRVDDAESRIRALAARPQSTVAEQRANVHELRAAVAEARRQPATALRHYQEVARELPSQGHAARAQALLLAQLGSPDAALAVALKRSDLHSSVQLAELRQAALGERLRWAIGTADLSSDGFGRHAALDEVIREAAELAHAFEASEAAAAPSARSAWRRLRQRLASDRIVALSERGLLREVVALEAEAVRHGLDLGHHAVAAVAGSHARLGRPEVAVRLYEGALRDAGASVRVPSDMHVGLVYAYLDTGDHARARRLVSSMLEQTPPLLLLSPEPRRPNNEYGDLLALKALVDLQTGRTGLAQRQFSRLAAHAPLHPAYRLGQARVQVARNQPHAAQASLDALRHEQPDVIEVQALHAENLLVLGRHAEARAAVDALLASAPQRPAVIAAATSAEAALAPRIDVAVTAGRDGGTLAQRELVLETRLSSRWSGSGRLYARHWWGRADVAGTTPGYRRGGIGLERQLGDLRLGAELHSANWPGRTAGLALSGHWRPSDWWQFSASLDGNALDVPWRARLAGLSARNLSVTAEIMDRELRRLTARWDRMVLDDGNARLATSLAWREQWWSEDGIRLETTVAGETGAYRRVARAYYSPTRASTAGLDARVHWLTWKRADLQFHQVGDAGAGRYEQAGFGAGGTASVGYAHEWSWGAGWNVRYGVSLRRHPYDGVPERRSVAFLNLSAPLP